MGSANRRDYCKRKKDPRVVAGPSTRSELSHANRACVARTNVSGPKSESTGNFTGLGLSTSTEHGAAFEPGLELKLELEPWLKSGSVLRAQAHFVPGGTVRVRSYFFSAALTGAA